MEEKFLHGSTSLKTSSMAVFNKDNLIEHVSRYNDSYSCTIERVQFMTGKIRISIDVRGDHSHGPIPDPMSSTLGLIDGTSLVKKQLPIGENFTVGYLDYPVDESFYTDGKTIAFQYSSDNYMPAKLFKFNEDLLAHSVFIFNKEKLEKNESRYDHAYCCTIEKVHLFPFTIRVFIDERGDNSLGPIQEPTCSTLGLVDGTSIIEPQTPSRANFSIKEPFRYLDYTLDKSFHNNEKFIGFQYGQFDYSIAKLFRLDKKLIDDNNLELW
ncbi:unnamed protein product [Rotaria magnacalcarata]